jgi:anti-sigma regulatory factor (Ser/Thr protein kinase)
MRRVAFAPTAPENLDRPSGRGLLLMRAFMDEVQFNVTVTASRS